MVPGDFFSSLLVMLCYYVLHGNVCRLQWNCCVKVRRCCSCMRSTIIRFAAESRKLDWNGIVRCVNGALAAFFSILVVMIFIDFPFANHF